MAEQRQFRSISIELETYDKLVMLSERNYRSVPKEISRLVDAEVQRVEAEFVLPVEAQ